ncbi:hypothetical protein SAMN05421594_3375 [Chryseobacterium oleae]|uniref:Uncharacterized protein n=1 Tax=Chryseobacterium oleae TaxID=491207 RepID=A0A1I5A6R0_CHROL|nr:hypothetical protein [Chryseobacterium oleae]SFN58124.1 hypothetical protein SAMN05421594_3375 [Chryseobacterium oleae]
MMKKNFLFIGLLPGFIFSQVGVNTVLPQSTLDVVGKKGTTDKDGLQAPRLTRAELTNKGNSLYGTGQTGTLIYISDVSGGDALLQRINITDSGYYYFNGSVWQKVLNQSSLTASNGINIVSGGNIKLGGPLTGVTAIGTSAANTLALTGLSTTTDNTQMLTVNGAGVISTQAIPGAVSTLAGSTNYDKSDGSATASNGVGSTMVAIANTTTTMTLASARSIFFNANVGIDDYTSTQAGAPYYKAELYLDDAPIASPAKIFTAIQENGSSVSANPWTSGARYLADGVGGALNFTLSGIINVPAGTHTVKLYMRKSSNNNFNGNADLRLIAYSASGVYIN